MKNSPIPLTYNHSFAGLIGFGRRDITPPVGIYCRNWGAALTDVAMGIHRPLTLTCMVVFSEQDTDRAEPLVLFSADLGWWKDASDEQHLRRGILQSLGLPESRLIFCLTHTHAGPSLFSGDRDELGGELIAPYMESIKEKALQAYHEACERAVRSTLSWHYGKCDLAVNRDLPTEDEGRFLVGFNPSVPADDTLLVGRITDESGTITGTIVNYACHPTVLAWENQLISPDYVGAMRELVEEKTNALCLFMQGASGELAAAEQYVGDVQLADAHGYRLGYAVMATLQGMYQDRTALRLDGVVESGAPLAIWKRHPRTPSNVLDTELIPVQMSLKKLLSLEEIDEQLGTCSDHVLKERLIRMRAVRKNLGEGDSVIMPLWVWRLGEACLVAQPNEAYSSFQYLLREALAPAPIAVINIANGYAGYLPPHDLYDKNLYAVNQTPFAQGSLELLTDIAISNIQTILNQDI